MWVFPHREIADVKTGVQDDPSPTAGARLCHEEHFGKQVKAANSLAQEQMT
jgi:hypothetical protein